MLKSKLTANFALLKLKKLNKCIKWMRNVHKARCKMCSFDAKLQGSFKKFYLLPRNFVNIEDSCMKFAMIDMIDACSLSYTYTTNSF